MYDTLLVPIDGSDGSNRAIEHALDISERFGADVHAMYVVDTNRYGEPALSSAELVIDEMEDEGNALLKEFAERADTHGIEVTTNCTHGAPHEEIIAYAREIDADLIVLGYQGHSHHLEENIGSVAERVVRMAGRPVLTA